MACIHLTGDERYHIYEHNVERSSMKITCRVRALTPPLIAARSRHITRKSSIEPAKSKLYPGYVFQADKLSRILM